MREAREIANKDLNVQDIPQINADWDDIGCFALSFNGYDYWGSSKKCSDIANKYRTIYNEEEGVFPSTLTELRTCLFFEQRRFRFTEGASIEKYLDYMRKIIEAIRKKVASKEFD